jgi:hypothetical protein
MSTQSERQSKQELIVSYLTLRKAVGVLGILLPFMLFFYSLFKGQGVQISISHYYFTEMRNEFVVVLSLISLFLFCYEGYDNDKYYSRAAGFFGLVVVFVHTTLKCRSCMPLGITAREIIHLGSAALFLGLLGYMSIFLFTKTNEINKATGVLPPKKAARNRIYKICGYVIFLCLILMVLYFAVGSLKTKLCPYKPVFWLESVAVLAFGFSWLVKGETILKD